MFSFFPRRASQFLPERSEPELRGGPIGLGGIRRSSHGEGENFWWLYQDAPLARPAGKSALRQPEALFSFTRPIGWVGSSVVEQRPFKPLVVGSNPTRPTTSNQRRGKSLIGGGELTRTGNPSKVSTCSGLVNRSQTNAGRPLHLRGHGIQTRAISANARPASSSDKYQSGFFFTTRQIDPIAIEI